MKVLIVDDEPEVGRALEKALKHLGHSTVRADHPDQALELLAGDIDAVITDIDMPGMSGVDLARRMRARGTRVPIAFCTGSQPGQDQVLEAASLGPVLTKVWTLQQVQHLVHALEHRASEAHRRIERRYRSRLTVRFDSSRDFLKEYTENLSRGGMFVRGAWDLALNQLVDVELEIPGLGDFQISARVTYVLDPDRARQLGRLPGAGLMVTRAPSRYFAALTEHMRRLESRRDYLVLASDDTCRALIEEAGYQCQIAPPPESLAAAMARSHQPVVGIIVPRRDVARYTEVLGSQSELVRGIDYLEELDDTLSALDEHLAAH